MTDTSGARFVHLHTHSHYSLLEALPKIDVLVKAAKADGQTALALTDAGNMYAAIEFFKECKKADIKPIIGVDFFVAPRTRHDKEHRIDDHTSRLVLLAKGYTGYRNLLQLVSKSYIEGFYYRPRVDRELLTAHHDGLIAILPSFGGEHARAIKDGARDRAAQSLSWYHQLYGDDCYVEITRHDEIEGHEERMKEIIALSREHHLPLVATGDLYYMNPDDAVARELVIKIRTGGTLNRDLADNASDFSFITQDRAHKLFKDIPEAITNTAKIADECSLELTLGKAIFPIFPIPEGTTDNIELRKLAESGIAMRGLADTPELRTRMDYELGIIEKKGYSSYFLIVADLMRFAREVGIYTNTRGSAAGSLVSYLCGITSVDPIAFNMPFERFLNPERPSAPDIDMDIADNRRDELIDYARRKYGDDHVAQIGTFGTMAARAAVRDVARALGYSYSLGDSIAKLIPVGKQGFAVTIEGSLDEAPELAQVYKSDAEAREVLDLAKKVEGNSRHVGVHAAGVVIAPTPVIDYSPIQPDPKGGKTITQYDMYSICDEYMGVGLVKFDFLGLKNLAVLADSVARVKARLGIDVDLDRVSLEDAKVFEMLARGETMGVFQMAGSGMTAYLKELKPTVVHDLNAMVALYRPGPLAFIPDYIARKHNPTLVTYLDPRIEPILKSTYGVLIYQDDVMMMAVQLAGYSWGEADKFRKAMGKKIPEEMAKQKDHFMDGCIERGMKPDVVQKLWEQIETFAAYGFNKAHAASYGNLAYKTAYMKANFPVDYMSALLTADAGDVEEISAIIEECKRMGIAILSPSVNESFGTFTVTDEKAIRFGLYSIKNFGSGVADSIIKARQEGGPFQDMADFLARVPDKNLNKKQIESLIQSGALDTLGERGSLLANLEMLLTYHREHTNVPTNQFSLFGAAPIAAKLKLVPAAPTSKDQCLAWEKELLGLYISGHPLDKFRPILERQKVNIKVAKEKLPRGVDVVLAGLLTNIRPILTKKGDKMIFAEITDMSDRIEIVVFPRTLQEYSSLLIPDTCILIKGKISDRNGEASFAVDQVKALDSTLQAKK